MNEYRASANEQLRIQDLLALTPPAGKLALDVGARDGYLSRLLAERFDSVVALDLTMPTVSHPKVTCVKGNAAALDFADGSFDFVLCAEVLEHVPGSILPKVCSELQRVCRGQLLIGVPYRQDLRLGRTTCQSCGKSNPPWGHIHSFDETRLIGLFSECSVASMRHVGKTALRTSALAAKLMDMAGNPHGTYAQDEACIHCGGSIGRPGQRDLSQKILSKLGSWAEKISQSMTTPQANWTHVLFNRLESMNSSRTRNSAYVVQTP